LADKKPGFIVKLDHAEVAIVGNAELGGRLAATLC
jgi:hypothetical protein